MKTADDMFQFEDYGTVDFAVSEDDGSLKCFKWRGCTNTALIREDSLQRTLTVIRQSSFAILTAYRKERLVHGKAVPFTKQENIERNRKLRAFLNQNRMGVHQLVGHWQEAKSGVSWRPGLKANEVNDTIERSYLVEKPDDMTDEDFCSTIVGCLTIDGETQDAALIKFESKPGHYYLLTPQSKLMAIGTKLTVGKISQAYSQHVKKMDVPFAFEGEEVPDTNFGKQLYRKLGFAYTV